ncbi:MAG TPA: hypothetical protein VKT53_11745 [Candidatus Acidoferrum sp.]|nr:hypothetical protein [Candidatus Acidoferrum sp.]
MHARFGNSGTQSQRRFRLRQNPHSWFAFRLALGLFGAALVLLPLALPQSWIASIFGLAFFLTSILLPPAHTPELAESSLQPTPPKHRIVLTGAEYSSADALPVAVKLFVSEEQVLAIKPDLQQAALVPCNALHSIFLQRSGDSWFLVMESTDHETVFSFRGIFAERNARKAESAIRQFVPAKPSEKPKVRAAGA